MFYKQHQDREAFKIYITMSAAVWVLMLLVVKQSLMYAWKSMGQLVSCMDKVSRGEYGISGTKAPLNEFGAMWAALHRMCRNLQMKEYRHHKEIEYLYQYTPRNFEQLFARERLQDIVAGEAVQIHATLGMIAVIDKDALLTGTLQRQYVQYVNHLMELLFAQKESEKAVFLQNGSSLENMKVIFKEEQGYDSSALIAVKYAIACMEALTEQTDSAYDTMPFMLLHTSVFSCGLAGGSRQVYPYVTSLEMETLDSYIDALKAGGVRIVVTEPTWQQLGDSFHGRYIGYTLSGDGKETFRLHEILDACPQAEKTAKIKNKECFEKALQLYYDNDLYLARSAFADILKECPQDGISRWYVFACDERFNREESLDEGHELFRQIPLK